MKYWIESRPVAGRGACGDFVEYVDLGHRRAIIVGDVHGGGCAASHAAGALSAYARNLVKLRVPLTTGGAARFRVFRAGRHDRSHTIR